VFNETWNWDGTDWTKLSPLSSPSGRAGASMAFDAATNQLILFGGADISGDFNDTWSWDGSTWTQLFPATSPPARSNAVMAFDPRTNQLILFGGDNGLRDTWSWDGSTWAELFPSTFPLFSNGASMAFDDATSQMVLVDTVGNTWNWDNFPFFVVATPPSQTIFSGNTASIALSSNVSGATFSWTASPVGVSGASNGSGALIAQTLSTTSTSPGSVTYTITPTSPTGCTGSPLAVIVTVDPPASVILPPTHVIGCREFSFTQFCKLNAIKWQPPIGGTPPVSYRIYRNVSLTNLAAEIPANKKREFMDDCYHSCKTNTYYIVAVDANGNQSTPVSVSIKKKRCH
jgi:PKD-like domain